MKANVSIIIPVFNTEKDLKNCLESVRNQSYENFEVILIDDGSTDKSVEICDYYSSIDNRFKVIHCINSGVSKARNRGIDVCQGDYIIFVDSDDKVKSNMLEDMVEKIQKYDSDVIITGITFVEKEEITKEIIPIVNGRLGLDIWKYICRDNIGLFGYVSNKLYKSSIIKENNIRFDENKKIQEDLDFALTVYSYCNSFYLSKRSYYLYNYEPKDRKPQPLSYMKIEIKKRDIIKSKGWYDRCKKLHCNKLSSMIFAYLYWLPKEKIKFFQGIQKIYEIDKIYESFDVASINNIEEKIIIFLLKKKRLNILWKYFRIRSIRNRNQHNIWRE